MQFFLVGGAVRDELLNYPSIENDWLVVGAQPKELLDKGYIAVGKDFPVFLHPDTKEEYALARTERKTGPGYRGFAMNADPSVTIEQDLLRRDLTINAIAKSASGELIDPYGGAQDIKNKWLRHVSAAFTEDPVRILRVARFAARYAHLGFRVHPSTLVLMAQMVDNGEVDHLVAERTWKEFSRALGEQNPQVFLEVLHECKALDRIMPELSKLFRLSKPGQTTAPENWGRYSLASLQQASQLSARIDVRFASLTLHLTESTTSDNATQQPEHNLTKNNEQVKTLCERLKMPNEIKALALLAAKYHQHCHSVAQLPPSTLLGTLEALDAFRKPERIDTFLLCCEADARNQSGATPGGYSQAAFFREAFERCRQLSAKQLMERGFSGKQLGTALKQARIDALAQQLQTASD